MAIEKEELLDEVANLNNQVATLVKEKEDILAMKVSQLGLKPDEAEIISEEENTKKNLHPHIDKYQYFLSGLKIKDDYFTVKSVIAIDQNNNRYYDHYIYNHPKELYLTTKKPRLIFRRDTS